MEAHLPFVAPQSVPEKYSLSQALRASSFEFSLKAAEKVGASCPPFGGQRTVASVRTKGECGAPIQASRALSRRFQVGLTASVTKACAARITNLQVQFKCRSSSLRIQRWYASHSNAK